MHRDASFGDTLSANSQSLAIPHQPRVSSEPRKSALFRFGATLAVSQNPPHGVGNNVGEEHEPVNGSRG